MYDAIEIDRTVLSPGRLYLLRAFLNPEDREDRLRETADITGLVDVMVSLQFDVPGDIRRRQADRWLLLLRQAALGVPDRTVRRDLLAYVGALEWVADLGEGFPPPEPDLERDANRRQDLKVYRAEPSRLFWLKVHELVAEGAKEGESVLSIDSLRDRRWPDIRSQLAERMFHLARVQSASQPVEPRNPPEPSLNCADEYVRLLNALNGPLNGMAVLAGPAGQGKTSFALGYVHWARTSEEGKARYNLVASLRGDNLAAFEHDFVTLGRVLAPDLLDAEASDLVSALHRREGWLILIDDVRDPAFLLRYLPRRASGHVICTYDLQTGEVDHASGTIRSRWHQFFGQPLAGEEAMPWPGEVREGALRELLGARSGAGPDDHPRGTRPSPGWADTELRSLEIAVGGSRLGLALAAVWLRLYGKSHSVSALTELLTTARVEPDHGSVAHDPIGLKVTRMVLTSMRDDPRPFEGDRANGSTFVLLRRLCSYDRHPIPLAAIHREDEDPRLHRLLELGLLIRDRLPSRGVCVEIHPTVMTATQQLVTDASQRRGDLAVATLTTLVLWTFDGPLRIPARMRAMLPHVPRLANQLIEELDGHRLALTAIELHARAAAICWLDGMEGAAAQHVRTITELLDPGTEPGLTVRVSLLQDLLARRERGWDDLLDDWAKARSDPSTNGDPQGLWDRIGFETPARRFRDLVVMLRRVGFRVGVLALYEVFERLLTDSIEDPGLDNRERAALTRQRAKLRFEGVVCYRENARADEALALLDSLKTEETARSGVDDVMERARHDAMRAVLLHDQGRVGEARGFVERSFLTRLERVRSLVGTEASADAELVPSGRPSAAGAWLEFGRGCFVLARSNAAAGFPEAMAHAARGAAIAFARQTRESYTIRTAAANANLAFALAVLRRQGAEEISRDSVVAADHAVGRDHRDAATLHLQHAWVLALHDHFAEGADDADVALRRVARHWPASHPFVLEGRLLAARCAAEAARVTEALHYLLVLLHDAGVGQDESSRRDIVGGLRPPARSEFRAAAWTAIGNLLVDSCPHLADIGPETDLELIKGHKLRGGDALALAEACFKAARDLFTMGSGTRLDERDLLSADDGSLGPSGYESPAMLDAGLGLVEVGLRLGRPDQALAAALYDAAKYTTHLDHLAADQVEAELRAFEGIGSGDVQESPPIPERPTIEWFEIRAAAKLVRTSTPAETGARVERVTRRADLGTPEFWEHVLTHACVPPPGQAGLDVGVPLELSARARLECALAWHKLLVDADPEWEGHFDALGRLDAWLVTDITRLLKVTGETAHHQIALRYALRASLPERAGRKYKAARNAREAGRSRVLIPSACGDTIRHHLALEA